MNKLDQLFKNKKEPVLNVYYTAGFPELESTTEVALSLQKHGADIIEIGIPYSDPIADGPVIQQSNMQAIANGISIAKIFEQLESVKSQLTVPVVLMGYLNPVLQFGMERFCAAAARAGISGVILPDLPMYEYEKFYEKIFREYKLHLIFLVTPETGIGRIEKADKLSGGFLYAVSSSATTGNNAAMNGQEVYFKKLQQLRLKNSFLIGFGVRDKATFDLAGKYAAGAIIGTAYIKALQSLKNIDQATAEFLQSIRPAHIIKPVNI